MFHYKKFRLVFLIYIPSIIAICYYIYGYYYYPAVSTGQIGSLYSNQIVYGASASAVCCYGIIILYGMYPLLQKHNEKTDYQNVAGEFEFVKKILFITIPILIILTISDQYFIYLQITSSLIKYFLPWYDLSLAIWVSSIAVVIGALLRIGAQIANKEFRFYLAKGYCITALNKKGTLEKVKYMVLSLDSYNKYLLRKINFGIKNINKIYSDLIHAETKQDETIKSVYDCLGDDRLKLANYLSTSQTIPEGEPFFIRESWVQKLRAIGVFLAATIPIAISIFQLISKLGT